MHVGDRKWHSSELRVADVEAGLHVQRQEVDLVAVVDCVPLELRAAGWVVQPDTLPVGRSENTLQVG